MEANRNPESWLTEEEFLPVGRLQDMRGAVKGEGLQCFIDDGVADWCGCGAIFDRTVWSHCPRCGGNHVVCASPVLTPRR